MEQSRLLRPVAHRVLAPELWRFTRRSVPRGVALGMVTGILFPIAQIPLSALLALPFRANVPTAALTTFITNPFTTPFLWALAYWIGKLTLRLDQVVPGDPVRNAASSDWMQWLHVRRRACDRSRAAHRHRRAGDRRLLAQRARLAAMDRAQVA